MYQYAEQTDNKRYKLIVNIITQIPKIVVKNYIIPSLPFRDIVFTKIPER